MRERHTRGTATAALRRVINTVLYSGAFISGTLFRGYYKLYIRFLLFISPRATLLYIIYLCNVARARRREYCASELRQLKWFLVTREKLYSITHEMRKCANREKHLPKMAFRRRGKVDSSLYVVFCMFLYGTSILTSFVFFLY